MSEILPLAMVTGNLSIPSDPMFWGLVAVVIVLSIMMGWK
jgi:hypothetical protein